MRTDSSPSDISSSEMPDSSSNSISFFTLRISIREPLENLVFLGLGQARDGGLERELVADRAQSINAAGCDIGQIRVMPICLAGEYVAQMNFDERHADREERIAQCDAGMREG